MKKLILLATLLTGASAQAAFRIGNGGDIVLCSASPSSPFNGYYLLDYLLTYDHATNNADLLASNAQPLEKIRAALRTKLPSFSRDFETHLNDMTAQLFARTDYTRRNIWVAQRLGLNDLEDEFVSQRLPDNCLDPTHAGRINLIQAVVREERPQSVIFQYDDLQIRELRRQSELQFSFLVVHEWLWYYAANANIVRDANRYLHSQEFQNASQDEAELVLGNLGLDLSREARLPNAKTVNFELTSCDPRGLTPLTVSAPAGVGVKIRWINRVDCGFDIFDPASRVSSQITVDAIRFGRTDWTKLYYAGSSVTAVLAYATGMASELNFHPEATLVRVVAE